MDGQDIFSVALACAALTVSATSFVLNYRHNRRSAILARKPVLVFEYDGEVGWTLRNVGSGPALNVIVAQHRVGGDWFNPVRVPPLSRDGSFVLSWLGHANSTGLGATYSDAEESPYTSTCGNDLSRSAPGREFGPWLEAEIGRHWQHHPEEE